MTDSYEPPDSGVAWGFVPVTELGDHEGRMARVPPVGNCADNASGRLRDGDGFFLVGGEAFSKDDVAFVAVEGVEVDRSMMEGASRRSGRGVVEP